MEFMEGKLCSVIDVVMVSCVVEVLNVYSEDFNFNYSFDFNNFGNFDFFSDSDMEIKIFLSIDVVDLIFDKRKVKFNGLFIIEVFNCLCK